MNTKQIEALKLALEALEECRRDPRLKYEHPYYEKTITAIREALAERCVCGEPDTPGTHRTDGPCLAEQPAQQEPVGKVNELFDEAVIEQCGFDRELLIYTFPPASKPLTDGEIDLMTSHIYHRGRPVDRDYRICLFREAEAAHGIGEKPDAA